MLIYTCLDDELTINKLQSLDLSDIALTNQDQMVYHAVVLGTQYNNYSLQEGYRQQFDP